MEHTEETPLLVAEIGPLDGERYTVVDNLVIGRDPGCDIVVITTDKQVSRKHARIWRSDNGFSIEDLGSKNGTHVNGDKINAETILHDGDIVQIALAQKFTFLSSDATVPLRVDSPDSVARPGPLLKLDKRARRVWITDNELVPPLSVAQFAMLDLLYQKTDKVISREELVGVIWGEEQAYEVSNQALDALVRRLRDRLAEYSDYQLIVTVRGHGLRLDNPQM